MPACASTTTTPTRPAQHLGPGPQVPTRNVDFPAVYDIPHWKNISPRLGIAFDLFGNGKTAVKASVGRYLQADNLTTITGRANPTAAIVTSASRDWNDANRDFIPQEHRARGVQSVHLRPERHHVAVRRRGAGQPGLQLGDLGQRPAPAGAAGLGDRRLFPPLVRQLHRHRQRAGDARPTTARSASPHRRIRGCLAAAAIRSAASTTSRSPSSGSRATSSSWRTASASSTRCTTASISASTPGCLAAW